MPETDNGTDKIFYNFYKKNIPTSLCFIHPNMITLFRAILILPIIDNIKNNESILIGSLLSLVFSILDCIDGATARKCNTSTKLGKILDIVFDESLQTIILIYCIIKIFKIKKKIYINKNKSKIVLNRNYIIILIFIFRIIYHFLPISIKNFIEIDTSIFSDNLIISSFISMLVIKFLLNNYTKTIKEIDEDK